MIQFLHTLLVLALPASGKSEARKRMEELADPERFHLSNETIQLDDYPYVRLMRHIDDILVEMGLKPIFFRAHDQPFVDPRSWEVLIRLINEDYAALMNRLPLQLGDLSPAYYMLERLRKACQSAEMPDPFSDIEMAKLEKLYRALEEECTEMVQAQQTLFEAYVEGETTIVIEFARGGPERASSPLDPPRGNQHALNLLSKEILGNASILWIRVTPEESRRKNIARARPGEDGTMHHCVPEVVMRSEYGTCDMRYLLEHSEGGPNTITVQAQDGSTHFLPVGTFNNMPDKTTCMHSDLDDRNPEEVAALDTELEGAMETVWTTRRRLEEW